MFKGHRQWGVQRTREGPAVALSLAPLPRFWLHVRVPHSAPTCEELQDHGAVSCSPECLTNLRAEGCFVAPGFFSGECFGFLKRGALNVSCDSWGDSQAAEGVPGAFTLLLAKWLAVMTPLHWVEKTTGGLPTQSLHGSHSNTCSASLSNRVLLGWICQSLFLPAPGTWLVALLLFLQESAN